MTEELVGGMVTKMGQENNNESIIGRLFRRYVQHIKETSRDSTLGESMLLVLDSKMIISKMRREDAKIERYFKELRREMAKLEELSKAGDSPEFQAQSRLVDKKLQENP